MKNVYRIILTSLTACSIAHGAEYELKKKADPCLRVQACTSIPSSLRLSNLLTDGFWAMATIKFKIGGIPIGSVSKNFSLSEEALKDTIKLICSSEETAQESMPIDFDIDITINTLRSAQGAK